jgi:thioredoxin reductase
VLCHGANFDLDEGQRELLAARDVTVLDKALASVGGDGTSLQWLAFADGSQLARSALFVHAPVHQRSDLPTQLGCRILDDGAVEINDLGQTSVPGVYAAGDMARRPAPAAGRRPGHPRRGRRHPRGRRHRPGTPLHPNLNQLTHY